MTACTDSRLHDLLAEAISIAETGFLTASARQRFLALMAEATEIAKRRRAMPDDASEQREDRPRKDDVAQEGAKRMRGRYCAGPVFIARFPGECPECTDDIEIGEEIRMADGAAVHADCHECTCGECE